DLPVVQPDPGLGAGILEALESVADIAGKPRDLNADVDLHRTREWLPSARELRSDSLHRGLHPPAVLGGQDGPAPGDNEPMVAARGRRNPKLERHGASRWRSRIESTHAWAISLDFSPPSIASSSIQAWMPHRTCPQTRPSVRSSQSVQ